MTYSNGERMGLERYGLRPRIWALTVCLVGFALLTYRLDEKSLWGDEAFNAQVVRGDLEPLLTAVARVGHPPLFFLCQWSWKAFAGDSEFSLRFPSVVFSTLSVAMLYPFGTRMLGKRVGLMAMSLMAISPFFVLYSRMARYYSLLLLLSLISYLLCTQLLDGPSGTRKWAGYVVSSTLGIYTHYLFVIVLGAQAAIAVASIRQRWRLVLGIFGSQMAVILLFAPWLRLMISNALERGAVPDVFGESSLTMWAVSATYPFFAWSVGGTMYPWNPAAVVGVALVLWLAARGSLSTTNMVNCEAMEKATSEESAHREVGENRPLSLKHRLGSWRTHQALPLLFYVFFPLFLTVVTMRLFVSGDPLLANRTMFCAPFMFLLLAGGIGTITRPGRRVFVVTALALVSALSLTNYYVGREFHNPNFVLPTRAVANVIAEHSQSSDVFVSDYMTAFGYYIERQDPSRVHFVASAPQAAKGYIEQHQSPRVWLVLLCRAIEAESLATLQLVPWLVDEGYSLELTFGYAPQDEIYGRVQELVLRKPACKYKVIVYRYVRV